MKTKLSIIYPGDPFGLKIGGPETFIKGFVKYAPDDFDIDFVGINTEENRHEIGQWSDVVLGKRKFRFMPLFLEENADAKKIIPLSLRYTNALKSKRGDFYDRVLIFNRIEPAVAFRKKQSRKIVVIHNDIEKQIKGKNSEVMWSKIPTVYFMLEKIVFRSMDFVYVVAKTTLDFYKSKYKNMQSKFSFIPTWVDTNIFYPVDVTKLEIRKNLASVFKELPKEKKWILFVGRLQKQKAPLRLLDVFCDFLKKNPSSCLIVIGQGNERKNMEKYIKAKGIQKDIYFLGNIRQETLVKYYRASDVMLLTSNYEGMPMCVLEALGCGLPVVSTDVGEVGSIIKNGFSGEICRSFSPHSISNALSEVVNNYSIYTKHNCFNSISLYIPEKAMMPLYDKIREIYNNKAEKI